MVTNLSMYRGDTQTYNLSFTDSVGTAINLSGYTIYFTVKNKNNWVNDTGDSGAIISSEVTSHTIATDGTSAIIITPSQTTSVAPGTYVYDIQLKDTSSNIFTILSGSFAIEADVTRRTT